MKLLRIVLGLALLVLVFAGVPIVHAWLVQRGVREVARAERVEAEAARERALATPPVAPRQEPAPAPAPDAATEDQREIVEGWWSEALQAMAREGMARGWGEVRGDALPAGLEAQGLARFRAEVEALAPRIGRELAEQRGRDEIVEAGIESAGVFTFLELLDKDAIGPFPDLVEDGERFGALFRCGSVGPVISGADFVRGEGPDAGLEDGTTLQFGSGVTRVNLWTPRGKPPRCLTIAGAGMDATLLVADAFRDGGRVDLLTIRDCTIFSTYGSFLDFRGKGTQTIVERVRVIGFDSGAGGSSCLDLDHTALLARDCRFEGGYGRDPQGGGTLFDVRTSALLARFERCRFDAMELELERLRGRATVVFSDCIMTDLRDRRDPRTVDHPGIRLVRCNVSTATPDMERVWKRDLSELFPGWQQAR